MSKCTVQVTGCIYAILIETSICVVSWQKRQAQCGTRAPDRSSSSEECELKVESVVSNYRKTLEKFYVCASSGLLYLVGSLYERKNPVWSLHVTLANNTAWRGTSFMLCMWPAVSHNATPPLHVAFAMSVYYGRFRCVGKPLGILHTAITHMLVVLVWWTLTSHTSSA